MNTKSFAVDSYAVGFKSRVPRLGTGLAGLLLSGWLALGLNAGVVCEECFTGDTDYVCGGGGQADASMVVTNQQAVLRLARSAATDPNDESSCWACFSPPGSEWKVQLISGQVVELSADLVNLNQYRAYAGLGLGMGENGYRVLMDRRDLTVVKYGVTEAGSFTSHLKWAPANLYGTNVLTLKTTFSATDGGVVIRVRVLDTVTRSLVWETQVVDTRTNDAVAGVIRGITMQPEGIMTPYTETWMTPFIGVGYINIGSPPAKTVAVTVDNFRLGEFVEPVLGVAPSVMLSWPVDTMEEQVVLATESLEKPLWRVLPEPVFLRQGCVCSQAPVLSGHRFFKLSPGVQFLDDFSDARQPFATRNAYVATWDGPEDTITVGGGVLRLVTQGPTQAGYVLEPPHAPVEAKDFHMSVDILDWKTTGNVWSVVSLLARGVYTGPDSGNGYLGMLLMNANGTPGKVELRMWVDGSETPGGTFGWVPGEGYRMEFSGVGKRLELRVTNLKTQAFVREMTLTGTSLARGFTGLWINMESGARQSHEIVLDNLSITGTH